MYRSQVLVQTCRYSLLAAISACATLPPAPVPGSFVTTITLVERGWHTDVCLDRNDIGDEFDALARDFPGARFLCFGFGERGYVLTHEHGLVATVSALFPSPAALLITVLRDGPALAFGSDSVIRIGVSGTGLAGLQAYLKNAVVAGSGGRPVQLGAGPYPGSLYLAATGTYDAFYTCNSWTADAMRSAGLPISGAVITAGAVMRQAHRIGSAVGDETIGRVDAAPSDPAAAEPLPPLAR